MRQIGGIDDGLMRLGALYSLSAKTVPRLVMGIKLRRPKLEFELSTGGGCVSNFVSGKFFKGSQVDCFVV